MNFPLRIDARWARAVQGSATVLIVIPTLNERAHVARLLDWLSGRLKTLNAHLVVVDGGSDDGTCEVVERMTASHPRMSLLRNPRRLQSAAVNLAVERFADEHTTWLIRIDAHALYLDDYCEVLIDEARTRGADSVVVSMDAVGEGFWQRAIALGQNGRFGNGGSAHRLASDGKWVDHGHHALMRLDAFRRVGGYDPTFSHNEDAELDIRLKQAGFRIWLTGRTRMGYLPRRSPGGLALQYFRFGRGRARTFQKHGQRLKPRQAVLVGLAPILGLAAIAPLSPAFLAPLALWLLACLAVGPLIAISERDWRGIAAGLMAGLMQVSWSAGFWRETLGRMRRELET